MPKKTKKTTFSQGVGRRKTASATAQIQKSKETSILINDKPFEQYFDCSKNVILKPVKTCNLKDGLNITIKVRGGGTQAQIEAVRLAIARALLNYNSEFKAALRREDMLTRDSREKERKKPGLKGARRAPQWSKR